MATKLADDDVTKNATKQLATEQAATARSRAEFAERTKGKPTPTQEENDIVALGGHILEHEDDGSGPDPNQTKSLEAAPAGRPQGYATRQHRASSES